MSILSHRLVCQRCGVPIYHGGGGHYHSRFVRECEGAPYVSRHEHRPGGKNPQAWRRVGSVTVPESCIEHDQSYETASWWRDYELAPGTYALIEPIVTPTYYSFPTGPVAHIPATVTAEWFPASFAGNPMSSPGHPRPDQARGVGEHTTRTIPAYTLVRLGCEVDPT